MRSNPIKNDFAFCSCESLVIVFYRMQRGSSGGLSGRVTRHGIERSIFPSSNSVCEQQAFEMDFYKDKAKLIDKLLEEGPTSTEEEDEALVTLKRESRMQNKFFACHVVVLVLVVVLGMCLFARVAYYGFQTTEYDQQSLNGGLFILILGHSIYCPSPLY